MIFTESGITLSFRFNFVKFICKCYFQALPKYNTILGQMLDLISRSHFEKLVKEYQTEYCAKGLKSWTQFVTMLFSQISGQHGLRSMEQCMNNQRNAWYHMGITNTEREIKRSTLSYANVLPTLNLPFYRYAYKVCQAPAFLSHQ